MTTTAESNRFPKAFRLSGHAAPDRLFASGQVLKSWPFRVVYRQVPPIGQTPLPKVVISVSKRQQKLATDRNRLRRRIRDIYRQYVRDNLLPAVSASGQDLHLALIYVGGQAKLEPEELEKKLIGTLRRLAKELGPSPAASTSTQ